MRADRHEDRPANRPVLDNWIQVVKKLKREVQMQAMKMNGLKAVTKPLMTLPSSERPLDAYSSGEALGSHLSRMDPGDMR